MPRRDSLPKKPPDPDYERAVAERVAASIEDAKDRIRRWKQHELEAKYGQYPTEKTIDNVSVATYLDLIGELRSAESRKRLIAHNVKSLKMKKSRSSYLITLQSNAVEAIRLRSLLQIPPVEKLLHKPIQVHSRREQDRVDKLVNSDIKQLFGPPCFKTI